MDPHSRHSQFNQRQTKSGPILLPRYMDSPQKSSVDPKSFKKPSSHSTLLIPRPIATNARVKQDEKYRKDMYLAFVNNALQQKANGNSDAFGELVNQFNPIRTNGHTSFPPSAQLRLWILALSHVVSRLERPHAALIEAIVGMPWITMDTSIVKSFTVFIGMLLSARPEYLSLILGKIAHGFTYQSGLQALDAGQPEGSSGPLTRRMVYDRLHYLLRHLLSLIPTLPNTLHPLLVQNFPHKRQTQVTQVTYIRNLFRVTEYCPELADRILATIIDRTIQIDVEIQVEMEELEDEETNQQEQNTIFEFDPFDTLVGQDGASDSDSESEDEDDNLSDISSEAEDLDNIEVVESPPDISHIRDMVNKLDSILKLTFDYFHRTHISATTLLSATSSLLSSSSDSPKSLSDSIELTKPSPVSIENGKSFRRLQFHTLLSIFDRTIIRTFKSRYTQFLLFWYCSLDTEFSDLFLGMLVEKALLDNNQPAVTRAAAASYLASFVSRAQFVDREGTRRVMLVLCNYLRSHLDSLESISQSGASPMAYHSVFYAVTQAVFLIFCFRWRDLQEDQEDDIDELGDSSGSGRIWMPQIIVLQRVVTSPLNPLKVCSENVVMQFARVAQSVNFIYCYSIMDANKRSDYNPETRNKDQPRIRSTILGDTINAELNTFFPFDPYRLPKSGSYIQGVYREWSSVAIDDDEEDEEEDHKALDDGPREYSHLNIPRPAASNDDTGTLGVSFEGMSISPIQAIRLPS